jgi:dTMP kinase
MLISIEGLDSSGKNTQAARLAKRLDAALFSFPRYDTPLGDAIKRILTESVGLLHLNSIGTLTMDSAEPLVLQACMLADKYDAASSIRTILKTRSVVCDRWIPSSYCYGKADGLDGARLERMHSSLPEADINIFLDVSPEEALRRRPEARDRYERDREKQVAVRANYKELWRRNVPDTVGGRMKWVEVNGEGTVEEVEARIASVLAAHS